jgi:hypothetical protein
MSRWNEREIARKLAERDELEPPAGLLEKIKSEIPPMIPAGTGEPEIDRQPSMPPRQRWLIAASLVATVGAGLFALHLRTEAPPVEETARTAEGARQPEPPKVFFPPHPVLPPPQEPVPQSIAKLQEAPAPKPQSRKDAEQLKALGYVSPEREQRGESGAPGGALGGLAGGAAPAAPPAAAAPAPPAEAHPRDDKLEVYAESPLLDERRAGTGTDQPSRDKSSLGIAGTVSQSELEKIPTARDPWAVLQSTPGVLTDRINVGGNESGQQSRYVGPGTANQPQARAKTADSDIVWTSPAPFLVPLKPDTGTASYDVVRRAIAAGKLPDPGEIRVGEILNAFDIGAAPPLEGAPTPFVHGSQYRLVRLNTSGINADRVTFNPTLVVRCRLVGSGVSTLYEVELRSGVSRADEAVAMLGLGDGAKGVTLPQLASSWDKASPGFRLAALAAEFAEILKGSPVDSAALHRLSAEIGKLPKGSRVSELKDLVKRVEKIQQSR